MLMNKLCLIIFPAITDSTSPTFTYCPNDISAYTAADTSTTSVTWIEPTAVDDSGSVFYTKTHASGDQFSVGMTTVVYYARDPSGNQASCTFDITITGKASFKPVFCDIWCPAGVCFWAPCFFLFL